MSGPAYTTVYVVDDERSLRQIIESVLVRSGLNVRTFSSGVDFLRSQPDLEPGCVVLDVCMPGLGGLEVLRRLRAHWPDAPVIMISGHGDIPTAVKAMQSGAVDFLEKPFRQDALRTVVNKAVSRSANLPVPGTDSPDKMDLSALLTDRELEVLTLLVRGDQNKTVAQKLSISPRTVEVHRARIMQRLQVSSFAELVRIAVLSDLDRSPN